MRGVWRAGAITALALSSAAMAQTGRFVSGQTTVYRFDYSNTTRTDMRALFGMDTTSSVPSSLVHDIRSEVHGSLEQTILTRDSVIHAVYTFHDATVKLVVNNQRASDSEREIAAQISKPIFVILSPAGRLEAIRLDPSLNELTRSFARTILGSTQFVIPQDQRTRQTWTSVEEDPAGVHVASYSREGSSTVVKTKLRYRSDSSRLRKGDIAATQVIHPNGNTRATISGSLMKLEADESQRVTVADKQIASGAAKFTMQRSSVRRLSRAEATRLRSRERIIANTVRAQGLFASASDAHADTTIQRTELGRETLTTLVARLSQLEKSGDTASPTDVYLKLKALVYLHPESSAELGRMLMTARANGPTMLIVSQALGAVGNAPAQTALVRAIHSRLRDWPALATLIPVLGGVRQPSPTSVSLILDLASSSTNPEIRSTARLAAGIMARSLEATSPTRSAVIVRKLLDELNAANTSQAKRDVLFALGNAGSLLSLRSLERLARDKDQSVRAAAVFALRWIGSARADSLLERAAKSDPDSLVRASATRAIELRRNP